jgi:hypothetical protein
VTVLGLDYSGGRPAGKAVAVAGYGFVARYLPNGLASGRVNLSPAEVSDMHAAGVAVVMVWESQANRAAAGRSAGVADATFAMAQAKVVGLDKLPIYFAVDFDLPDYSPAATSPVAKLGPVGEYFAGVVSVLGLARTGVYGGYWAVRRVLDAGLATWAWQTVAWSGGNVDPRIHLYQRAGYVTVDGVQCDVNEARQTNFGQGPASSPTPITTEDDDMPFWVRNSKGDTLCLYGNRMVAAVNGSPPPAGALVWPVGDDEWASFIAKENEAAASAAALAELPAKLDAATAALKASGGSTGGGGPAPEYELAGTLIPKTS